MFKLSHGGTIEDGNGYGENNKNYDHDPEKEHENQEEEEVVNVDQGANQGAQNQ